MDAEKVAQYAAAQSCMNQAAADLVADEIRESLPGLEQAEEQAAAALEEAFLACEGPQAEVDAVQKELDLAESKALEYAASFDDADVVTRVEARRWHSEWAAEVERLHRKRDEAEQRLLPLQIARDRARTALDEASETLRLRKLNADTVPFFAHGQRTNAYVLFRANAGQLVPILLAGQRNHAEWDTARDWLLYLCQRVGISRDELPEDSAKVARFWNDYFQSHQRPEAVPSGAEVVSAVHEEMSVAAMNKRFASDPGVPPPQPGWDGPSAPSTFREVDKVGRLDRQVQRLSGQVR